MKLCWTLSFCRISSEDSGDVPSYTEDSDDSYSLELDMESRSGQMNLLEEILDSLNTTTVEQGKLSAAKSLDFFRSMEDLDYKPPVCIHSHIITRSLIIYRKEREQRDVTEFMLISEELCLHMSRYTDG